MNLENFFFATGFGGTKGAQTRDSAFYNEVNQLTLPNTILDISKAAGPNGGTATLGDLQDVTLNLSQGVTANTGGGSVNDVFQSQSGNTSSGFTTSGAVSITGSTTTQGDAQLTINNSNVVGQLNPDSNVLAMASGDKLGMADNSTVDTTAGVTAQLTCGLTPSGAPNQFTASDPYSSSTTCNINSVTGVGTFTWNASGGAIVEGTAAWGSLVGSGDVATMAAGDTLTINGNNDLAQNGAGLTGGTVILSASSINDTLALVNAAVSAATNDGFTLTKSGDVVSMGAGDGLIANAGNETITGASGVSIDLGAKTSGDLINVSNLALGGTAANGGEIGIQVNPNVVFTLQGNNDGANVDSGSTMTLLGSGFNGGLQGTVTVNVSQGNNQFDATSDLFNITAAAGGVKLIGGSDQVGDTNGVTGGSVSFLSSGSLNNVVNLLSGTVTAAANDGITASGGNSIFQLGAGDGLFAGGNGQTITGAAGVSISLAANTSGDLVNVSNLQLGGSATATGGGEIGVLVGAGAAFTLSGNNDGANVGANSSMTLLGSGFNGNLGTNVNVGVAGTNDHFDATSDTFTFTAPGAGISLAQGGGNQVLDATWVNGGSVLFQQSSTIANIADLTGATISAVGGITLSAVGSNDQFSLSGGDIATITGTGGVDSGGAALIDLGSATSSLTVGAAGATVQDATGVSGGAISLSAAGVIADLNGGTVSVASGLGFTGGGGSDLFNVLTGDVGTIAGSGQTVAGSGATLDIANASTSLTVSAVNSLVQDASGVTGGAVTLASPNDTVNLNSGAITAAGSITFWGNGQNDRFTLAAGDVATIGGSGQQVGGAGGTIDLASAANPLTITNTNAVVQDASGVNGGTVNIGSAAANLTIASGGLAIGDASGITGGVVNVAAASDVETVQNATVNVGGAFLTTIIGSGDVCNASTAAGNGDIYVGGSSGSDIVNWLNGNSSYASSTGVSFNPNSSTQFQLTDWSGGNLTGSEQDILNDWTAGGSQLTWFNPESGVSEVIGNFTGANESGELTTETLQTNTGYSEDFSFNYNGNGQLTGYSEDYYHGGTYEGSATFNGYGQETGQNGTVGGYGSYEGGYGYGAARVPGGSIIGSAGRNIGAIAVFDRALRREGSGSSPPPATVAQAAHAAPPPAIAPSPPGTAAPSLSVTSKPTVEPVANPHLFAPSGFVQAAAAFVPSAADHIQAVQGRFEPETLIAKPHCAYA